MHPLHRVIAAIVVASAAAGCAADDDATPAAPTDAPSRAPATAPATAASSAPASAPSPSTADGDARPALPTEPPRGAKVDRHLEALPDDVTPVAWTDLPRRPALEGPLAVNRLITDATLYGEDQLTGAEDIAPGLDGHLYTGTADGGIWRIVVDGADVDRIERVATVEGRPLGLDAYSEDVMIVAVALQGLVAVDTTTGESWVLSDRLDGNAIFFADGVSVAGDGTIYFTEASTRYYPGFPVDFLDGRPRGRLLRYEPATGETDVVADRLYFANGVVVAPDESYALVAESFRFRVTKVRLGGDRHGATEPFGPSLVNGADNLKFDDAGRVWVGGSNLRDDLVDTVLTNAELRRQLADTPVEEVRNAREPYGFAQVLSAEGDPLHSFHDTTGRFFAVSGALAADGFVTFASLDDRGIARIPLPPELR